MPFGQLELPSWISVVCIKVFPSLWVESCVRALNCYFFANGAIRLSSRDIDVDAQRDSAPKPAWIKRRVAQHRMMGARLTRPYFGCCIFLFMFFSSVLTASWQRGHTLLHHWIVLRLGDKDYRDQLSHNAAAIGPLLTSNRPDVYRKRSSDLPASNSNVSLVICLSIGGWRRGKSGISHLCGIRLEDFFIDIDWRAVCFWCTDAVF